MEIINKYKFQKGLFDFFRKPVPAYDFLAKIICIALVFIIPLDAEITRTIAAYLVILFFAAGGLYFRFTILRKNPWIYASLAIYLMIWLGSYYGGNAPIDVRNQLKAYAPILLPLVVISLLREEYWRRMALWAFMISMFGTLVASYVHYFWQFPGARSTIEGAQASHHIFKSHITQSVMMSFFVLSCYLESWRIRSKLIKAALWLVGALGVINIIIMTAGRTGYVSLALIFLVMIFSTEKFFYRKILIMVLITLSVCAAFSSEVLRDRVLSVGAEIELYRKNDEITSSGARLKYWEESVKLILERPIFGFGTGSWKKQFCRIADSDMWCQAWSSVHPHNQFLHFGVQFGVFGIIIYFIYLLAVYKVSEKYSSLYRLYVLGLLGLLFVQSMIDVPLYIVDESYFFPVLISIFLAAQPLDQNLSQEVFR